jgi:hypothetical protein
MAFQRQLPEEKKRSIPHLDVFADGVPSTLRKIDETEPTSMNTHYIARFQVPMQYSNTMEVFHQFVHMVSAGRSNLEWMSE